VKECRLAIIGLSGRMGREIHGLAEESGFRVVAGVSASADSVSGIPSVAKIDELKPESVDLIIDFSLPSLTPSVAAWCSKHRKPLVSGVTGLEEADKKQLASAAANTPILWAPNMSLGVAVLARMIKNLASLEGFDFQIEELHHNKKKDKPSGTALFLQDRLNEAVAEKAPAPLAIRGGGIFGIHRIWAMGEEEVITLEHTAMNRRVFARGALKAAQWLLDRGPGLYCMDDVLGT
jgi:4-hydroxy-tetrahydrodipicolinate reductase